MVGWRLAAGTSALAAAGARVEDGVGEGLLARNAPGPALIEARRGRIQQIQLDAIVDIRFEEDFKLVKQDYHREIADTNVGTFLAISGLSPSHGGTEIRTPVFV